jgi:sugar diacid utilization regulator
MPAAAHDVQARAGDPAREHARVGDRHHRVFVTRHDQRRLAEALQHGAEDREHGGHLIATLLASADADLNAKAAAEALLIHPNTAHYRLARIAEKTGSDLRRLPDVIDLLIAIRLTSPDERPGAEIHQRS